MVTVACPKPTVGSCLLLYNITITVDNPHLLAWKIGLGSAGSLQTPWVAAAKLYCKNILLCTSICEKVRSNLFCCMPTCNCKEYAMANHYLQRFLNARRVIECMLKSVLSERQASRLTNSITIIYGF